MGSTGQLSIGTAWGLGPLEQQKSTPRGRGWEKINTLPTEYVRRPTADFYVSLLSFFLGREPARTPSIFFPSPRASHKKHLLR